MSVDCEPSNAGDDALRKYQDLFQITFPGAKHLDSHFLRWLYSENPSGPIFGTDAVDDGKVVAHVAMIPFRARLRGKETRALLALNVATHPKYQGRGLFARLVKITLERARTDGFTCVVGVANANAYLIWIRKLRFQDVAPLEARIGLRPTMKVDYAAAEQTAEYMRLWSPEDIDWRARNPANPLAVSASNSGLVDIWGKPSAPFIAAHCRTSMSETGPLVTERRTLRRPFTLHLGVEPKGTFRAGLSLAIPERLKPSPLRLIYYNIENPKDVLDKDKILFRFIDFDGV